MRQRIEAAVALLAVLAVCRAGAAPARTETDAAARREAGGLLEIAGAYLAYSFDLNRIYGDRVAFDFAGYAVSAGGLKADIASRTFLAFGGVALQKEGATVLCDEFLFTPGEPGAAGIYYGNTIEVRAFPGGEVLPDGGVRSALTRKAALDGLTLGRIRESLVFSTARILVITPAFEVIGRDVVMFVEGLPSVGFARLKLSLGERRRTNGLFLDKIWFSRDRGLFANAGYVYDKENVIGSFTQARFEEHSILKSYAGLPRQLDLQTETTWTAAERLDLGLSGNVNSSGLWNARFSVNRAFKDDRGNLLFDLRFDRPLGRRQETWLGFQTAWHSDKWGVLNASGRTETRGQRFAAVDYRLAFGRHFQAGLNTRYARLRLDGAGGTSNILTGDFTLSYDAERVTAAAEYSLNRDLVGDQRFSQPLLRLGLLPFRFYGGLLEASIQNTFIANDLRTAGTRSRTYNDNLAVSLTARPIHLLPAWTLRAAASLEQFLEKEGRNFTSGGLILRSAAALSRSVSLEGFYSVQSRRRTRGRLIEGTTSQDLTAGLRLDPAERLNGWITVSFDPKTGLWKQGFADLAVGLVRGWVFQSLLSYDFSRKKIQNVDLYLVRHAGRFDLRFIWRSLSRQILIELIPAFQSRRPAAPTGKMGESY